MINCNPETVSTDYDTQRPALLRAAHARGRARGHPRRVAVRRAGRASSCSSAARPRSAWRRAWRPLASRSSARRPEAIDLAEERGLFAEILDERRPARAAQRHGRRLRRAPSHVAEEIGYPVLVRPSFVLGGRGMEIVYDTPSLADYFERVRRSGHRRARRTRCWSTASSTTRSRSTSTPSTTASELYIGGVMEHIEEAGIHSGDSSCTLPPITLGRREIDRVREATLQDRRGHRRARPAERAVRDRRRGALRARGEPARVAHRAVRLEGAGHPARQGGLADHGRRHDRRPDRRRAAAGAPTARASRWTRRSPSRRPCCRSSASAPRRATIVDSVLGPEMRSTGEVMGIDRDFPRAFAKSQEAAYGGMPLQRHRLRLGRRPRQARDRAPGAPPAAARLRHRRDRGHRRGARPQRHRRPTSSASLSETPERASRRSST